MRNDKEEITFKIITLGNAGVGKTSILCRYISNIFRRDQIATIGLDFSYKTVILKNGKKVKLKLFDTAGQERFQSFSKTYFRNTDCILLVYAVDNYKSFENIKDWIQIFTINHISQQDTLLYLIENKIYLERKVDQQKIDDFLKDNDKFKFKSISPALENDSSINDLFQEISEILYIKYKNIRNRGNIQNNIHLTIKKKKKKRNTCYECASYF